MKKINYWKVQAQIEYEGTVHLDIIKEWTEQRDNKNEETKNSS